ncbi:unnamed protein product [Dicrocoelium dendriticum]|nr:unnamed protein product [Dicrocoelium dendriticum]
MLHNFHHFVYFDLAKCNVLLCTFMQSAAPRIGSSDFNQITIDIAGDSGVGQLRETVLGVHEELARTCIELSKKDVRLDALLERTESMEKSAKQFKKINKHAVHPIQKYIKWIALGIAILVITVVISLCLAL